MDYNLNHKDNHSLVHVPTCIITCTCTFVSLCTFFKACNVTTSYRRYHVRHWINTELQENELINIINNYY